ncbi:hypothetical protein C3942_01040 [Solimonas fluminis]|uniref:HTH tetR-type domain-containing protein n=1 Tax=Solimonas fluminis TaxID=2086571 RepID=A0A2S5TL70_9GAMM|nr:TetR family transcriptional regulator [Solimonas fluminis]PPE75508.1 hypothetical protein C3942_01040 [Solimonas fluminis]
METDGPTQPGGKQRLIEAAFRLAARNGNSLSSLGLRELAREAGLNHNTFYRHFETLEDLGHAAAAEVAGKFMAAMKEIRRNAARHADASVGAAEYFLDWARDNSSVLRIGVRELHNAESPMRKAMQRVIHEIATESVDQITSMKLVPGAKPDALLQATTSITYYMCYRALDYLESPRQRRVIRDDLVSYMRAQFLGRLALQQAAKKPFEA